MDSTITILILGAGINGAALARELVLNGVSVCLVEQSDIASGASSASSRLIHGGLRYLEYADFDLVRESLQERGRLLQLAPHFVTPLQLFIPIERRLSGVISSAAKFLGLRLGKAARPKPRGLWLVRIGLRWYDAFAKSDTLPRHQLHRSDDPHAPPIDRRRYRWLCSYHDAQIIATERFILALLEDARRIAAERNVKFELHTYRRARRSGDNTIEIRPVEESSSTPAPGTNVSPAAVVNATGAWIDRTLNQLQVASARLIGGAKGSHFITANAALREALNGRGVYAEADDGRPFFLLPFERQTLVGTTDIPFDDDPAQAVASEQELEYLLASVRRVFPQIELTADDITLHYSGVRPLAFAASGAPASATRRHHVVETEEDGLPVFSLVGGKLTTCRSLAEQAAAAILKKLDAPLSANSRQRVIPGGEIRFSNPAELAHEQEQIARRLEIDLRQARDVWRLFGARAEAVLAEAFQIEGVANPKENLDGTHLPMALVRWIVRHEWVVRLNDLVERRLMLLHEPTLRTETLRQLARCLVNENRLPENKVDSEVETCKHRLQTHFGRRLE